MKDKGYRYYRDTELFNPNSMAYVERDFESSQQGQSVGLNIKVEGALTQHRAICDQLRSGADILNVEQSAEVLIAHYRHYGHFAVDLGLYQDERRFPAPPDVNGVLQGIFKGTSHSLSITDWHQSLKHLYGNQIAFEFMHADVEQRDWFVGVIESDQYQPDTQELLDGYTDIVRSCKLEKFLGINFVGQKRFSLEGCEALVPVLERTIKDHVAYGYDDVVLGMAHRGRINALINVLGLPLKTIVSKFDGNYHTKDYTGDVKYHLGHSVDRIINDKHIHIALCYNPSHLEAINSVAMGNVRARIDHGASKPFAILIHGDAAIAGQGVVMETMSMSKVNAYDVGGAIHIVVNNQIGFTTNPSDARSTHYCTDIAKLIGAPVMHVRADDLSGVLRAAKIAAAYKHRFNADIFIDVIGYRKYGHNEADEPRATQPGLYHFIADKPPLLEQIEQQLIEQHITTEKLASIKALIDGQIKAQSSLIEVESDRGSIRSLAWKSLQSSDWREPANYSLDLALISQIAHQLVTLPEQIKIQAQVKKLYEQRKEMAKGLAPVNWGMAELLAYQYLVSKGYSVRLVGQDCIRGTFAHRHATIYDQETGDAHSFVKSSDKASFENYNSILSEYAALGFEYGYSETNPNTLVLFEAQFGDFINGAQIIIDQFISSGFQKWQRSCGLVMLLPHGYEGQGPEHSSARLERFLQLASQDSIQICVPSTAAQIFKLLLRQMFRPYRRPLIVMSPKSLLRRAEAQSDIDELIGDFSVILEDDPEYFGVKEVVLCSGKVYYDLYAYRKAHKKQVAIIRLEQLYPFPDVELSKVLKRYKQLKTIIWCQEEPRNQGAWNGIRDDLMGQLTDEQNLLVKSRPAAAAPAVGYASVHQDQQNRLIEMTFEGVGR
ncbi:2-oxoglutarate dehydrogenase E1 component [Candidatus Comchoanobacter bicostacola]|uniref:oxoglutarate dehydrogenase (succinyl-transferring) n=1 Tax=Candidatus Comchoanobacter bicostacola TaxID=2919598 RepID=A0ABY5DMD5_9GAMM|nr:2-oxoglutarate dehydrogenase E1 component [Candidatus Comchoanobacter bicostacola]UTC24881.1 2-oxoglutarate dehydrogenase E1 component [Candidatus Comchoanobacter bicostacola]